MQSIEQNFWLISVNMGYGHQRTAFPLMDFAAEHKNININDYFGIPYEDRKKWELTRRGYELVSDFKKVPLLGNLVFGVMDSFQRILDFYPKRDLSKPTFQLKQNYSMISKGWGKHLIDQLKEKNKDFGKNLPIISTFFTPAFMAEIFEYPGDIFCVVCDADISRAWAPLDSKNSKIKYLAPTERVVERLKLYGVKKENIFLTGFPLPLGNIGLENEEILRKDLKNRLINLDPQKKYFSKYKVLIVEKVGQLPQGSDHPLTITFCVGGAGAQREIGVEILKKLKDQIKQSKIKLILVAGIRGKVRDFFLKQIKRTGTENGVEIIFSENINDYFQKFNFALRKTDILWTKPSELSFYSALGLPIIIAPTIGSQEEFNRRWLLKSGFGLNQENPRDIQDWIFDWLDNGYLAEAAMQGFIEGNQLGVLEINKIVNK
jgi:hypothetical protein